MCISIYHRAVISWVNVSDVVDQIFKSAYEPSQSCILKIERKYYDTDLQLKPQI